MGKGKIWPELQLGRWLIFLSHFLNFCNNYLHFSGEVPRADLSTRPVETFMCSVLRRQGYGEGFRWLAQYLD